MKRFLTLLFALALLVPWANAACYLIGPGAGGSWNYTSSAMGAELTETSTSGVYQGVVTLDSNNTGGWFTVCTGWANDWGTFNSTYRFKPNGTSTVNGNGTYYMQLGDGSFQCTASGDYLMTVNLNNNSFTLADPPASYPANLYLIGSIQSPSSWNISNSTTILTGNGSGVYTGTVNLTTGEDQFRFYTALGNWDSGSIGARQNDGDNFSVTLSNHSYSGSYVNGGKGNWVFGSSITGTLDITVDMVNGTVLFENTPAQTYSATIYFIAPSSWTTTPHIHAWDGASGDNQAMTLVGGKLYSYSLTGITANPGSFKLAFSNGNWDSGRTSDGTTVSGIANNGTYYFTGTTGTPGTQEQISGAAAAGAKQLYLVDTSNNTYTAFSYNSTTGKYYINTASIPASFYITDTNPVNNAYGYWKAGATSALSMNTDYTSSAVLYTGGTNFTFTRPTGATITGIEVNASGVTQYIGTSSGTIYSNGTLGVRINGTTAAAETTTIYYYKSGSGTPNIAIDHSNDDYDVASTAMTSAGGGWYSYSYTQATAGTYSLTIDGATLTGLSYAATSSYTKSSSPISANNGKLVAYVANGTSNVASAVTLKLHKPSGWTTAYVSLRVSGGSTPYYQAALSDDTYAGWYTVTIPAANLPSSGVDVNFYNGSANLWNTWASAPASATAYSRSTTATAIAAPSTYGFKIDHWNGSVSGGTKYSFTYDSTNKVYTYDATDKGFNELINFGLLDDGETYHWGTISHSGDGAADTWYTASTVSTSWITNEVGIAGKQFTTISIDAEDVEKTLSGEYSGSIKMKFAVASLPTYTADIYFVKPSSWDFTPYLYTWGPELVGNPGTQMTQIDGNLYKLTVTSTVTSYNVMFNSGSWSGDGGTQTANSYELTGITDGSSYYFTTDGTNVESISGPAAASGKAFYLHDWNQTLGLGEFVQFQWDSTNSVYYIDVTGKTLPTTFNVIPFGSSNYSYGYWQNATFDSTNINTAVTLARTTDGDTPAAFSFPRGTTVTRLELNASAVTEILSSTSGTAYTTGNITLKAVGTLPVTKNVVVRFFRPIWNDEFDTDWTNTPYLAYSLNSDFSGDTSIEMTAITDAAYTSTKGAWYQATIPNVLTSDVLYIRFHDGSEWDKYTQRAGEGTYEIEGAPDSVCLTLKTERNDEGGYDGVFGDSRDRWKTALIAPASCPGTTDTWSKPLTIHFYRQRFPHAAEWANTPVAVVYAGYYPNDVELTFNTTESSSYVAWYDVTIPANTIPETAFNVAMRNGTNAADGQTTNWYVSEADAAVMADICATMMQAASGKNHTLRRETCPGTVVDYYFWDAGKVITGNNVYTDALGNHFVKFTQISPHYFYIDIPAATDGLYHNYKITTGVGFHADNEAINDWGGCYDGIKAESEITLPNEWKKIRNVNGWADNYDAMQYATDHIGIKRIFINDFNINDAEPRLWVSFEQQYPLYMHTWETNTQDHSSSQYEHVDVGAPNYVFTELTTEQKKFQFITDILVANNIPAGNSYQVAYGVIFPEPLEVKEDRIKQGEGFLVRYGGSESDEVGSFLQCDQNSYIVSDQFEATGLEGVGGHSWHRDYGVYKGAYNAVFLVRDEQDPTQLFVIASSKGSAEGHQVSQDITERNDTRDICLGASMTWQNPTNLDGLGIKGIFPCKQIYKIVDEDGEDILTFDQVGDGTTDITSQLVTNIATYYGLPYDGRFYVEIDFSIGIKAGKWFDFEVVADIAKPVESLNISASDVQCTKSQWGFGDHADTEFQYVADFDWTMPDDALIVNQYQVFAYDSDLYDSPDEAEAAGALATATATDAAIAHTGEGSSYENPLTVHSEKDSSKQTLHLTYGVRPLYKVYFLDHPTTDKAAALAVTYPSAGSRLRDVAISSFDNVEAEPTTQSLTLNNVVTAILGIDADRMPVRGIYNLQGQRVRETIPGQFYIINGKKTMVNSVIRDEEF